MSYMSPNSIYTLSKLNLFLIEPCLNITKNKKHAKLADDKIYLKLI